MSEPALDLDLDDGGLPTFSVGELADAINGALRSRFFDGVWVRGEIQGFNERGPHAYFRLVEGGEQGKAVLNVQFFANSRVKLRPVLAKHRLRLADGLRVRIFGHLDYFAPSAQLGLKMSGIDPRFTLGDLAMQRDEVLRRLDAEGLLRANRNQPLAVPALRIGVVTSLDGAAWADFSHELQRSGLGFHVRVIDVRVQGEWATSEVRRAIRTLAAADDLDIIAVIRGGGARSELATFDSEAIARAIAASPIPVFTGLGHEVDRAVADEVAHTALKTPTACAVALVEAVVAAQRQADQRWAAVCARADRLVAAAEAGLSQRHAAVHQRTTSSVDRAAGRLADRIAMLRASTERSTNIASQRLDHATITVRRTLRHLDNEERHLGQLEQRVRLLDPVHTMARGWSITRTADGRTVRDARTLSPGDQLVTTFAAGTARSTVQETAR
jgi:exodeoxyribonuclease VII large subunit